MENELELPDKNSIEFIRCALWFHWKYCNISHNIVDEKESLAQMFSCEFCEISKNTFFTEHLLWLLL